MVVSPLVRILDTGALLAYAESTGPGVAYELAYCAERGWRMQTSALCVAEAARAASEGGRRRLEMLLSLPQIAVVGCTAAEALRTGVLHRQVGRLGLAHSCLLAMATRTPVLTTEPDVAERVLERALIRISAW